MYTTCVKKICINADDDQEEITFVSMKHFTNTSIEIILEENLFQPVAITSLAFCRNLVLFKQKE